MALLDIQNLTVQFETASGWFKAVDGVSLQVRAGETVGLLTHFVLSHPLRRPIVKVAGERGFLLLYSLVAFATLGWM